MLLQDLGNPFAGMLCGAKMQLPSLQHVHKGVAIDVGFFPQQADEGSPKKYPVPAGRIDEAALAAGPINRVEEVVDHRFAGIDRRGGMQGVDGLLARRKGEEVSVHGDALLMSCGAAWTAPGIRWSGQQIRQTLWQGP